MKKITSIVLFTLTISSTFSQTIQEKEQLLASVFEKIYLSSGEVKVPPTIKLAGSGVAFYYPDAQRIDVSEKAFDFCSQFGDRQLDALAMVLSHEIGHHFTHDFWDGANYSDFKISLIDSTLVQRYGLAKNQNQESIVRVIQEIKADERGAILRYLGGFSSEDLSEQFLTKIYDQFKINSACYPPLEQRIKIAHIGDSLAQNYLKIFETSTFLMLIKNYDLAAAGFEYLIKDQSFQSREIYNNLGVIYYLKAMQLLDNDDDKKIKFLYPVEIDLESRIVGRGSTKGFTEFENYMIQAILYFDNAVKFDQEYATAYLNRACIRRILKSMECVNAKYNDQFGEAEIDCKKAIAYAKNDREKQNAEMVLSIINFQNGNKKAANMMAKIAKKGNEYAEVNLEIMKGDKVFSSQEFNRTLNFPKKELNNYDNIDNDQRARTYISKVTDYELEQNFISSSSIKINGKELATYTMSDSKVYVIHNTYLFHTTSNNYSGATIKGIKIGDDREVLINKHGIPKLVLPSAQGSIYCYENGSKSSFIFIILNPSNQVSRWVVAQIF